MKVFCPACGSALAEAPCADPAATCLTCQQGHRYFTGLRAPDSRDSATAAETPLPSLAGKPDATVAQYWLTDTLARSLLNEQLAELLRTIVDGVYPERELPFLFCPLCSEPLASYEQPDIWVQGLRCLNNHEWAERGGRIGGGNTPGELSLARAPTRSVAHALVRVWLSGNPLLEPQLHPSVRRVLERWSHDA